ncbi:MAG: hypothetical protein Q9163_000524 [Psora crenata]
MDQHAETSHHYHTPTRDTGALEMQSCFQDELLLSYSDADLAQFIRQAPRLPGHNGICLLSKSYLAKCCDIDEVEDTIQAVPVARRLGIRTPSIERAITVDNYVFCVMERIEGSTLEELWRKLSWLTSARLAIQLRQWVRRLRSVTSSTAGSLATGKCRSFWLDDLYGLPARSRPEDIAGFIQFWTDFVSIPREIKKTASQHAEPAQRCKPWTVAGFVLTHHDLAPRNLMLDRSGDLWLLDWEYTGWYPKYFEYTSMHNFQLPAHWNWWTRLRWRLFTYIVAGRFKHEAQVLESVRSRSTRFRAARRLSVIAKGTAASRVASS